MIDERRTTQASRYVLGTLPIEEQAEFEAALDKDPRLQLLVKELRGTSGPKSTTSAETVQPSNPPVAPAGSSVSAWVIWPPWLLVGGLVVLCLALFSSVRDLRQQSLVLVSSLEQKDRELNELKRENQALGIAATGFTNAQRRIQDLESQFLKGIESLGQRTALTNQLVQQLAEATAELAVMRSNVVRLTQTKQTLEAAVVSLGARETNRFSTARLLVLRPASEGSGSGGALFWSGLDQRGVLVTDHLPTLTPVQSLQLWLVSGTNPPVSAGLLPRNIAGNSTHFAPATPVENLRRAFLTIESVFGSAAPGDKVVLEGN